MTCESRKQDSNITGLSFAEEECLKQLPANPVWYGLEPNSYSDFGGEMSSVARSPIDPSRQNKKGTITDMDASGGFNTDFTQNNLFRLLQGFFFADARERITTHGMNTPAKPITSVVAADGQYVVSGMDSVSSTAILLASGFQAPANNGLKLVTAVTGTSIEVEGTLADETVPANSEAKLSVVGYRFASGDIALDVDANKLVTLTATAADFTTLDGFYPGAWIFVGGDGAANNFGGGNIGYARIRSVAAKSVVLDDVTWTPSADSGNGKTIHIYVGDMIRNEFDPSLIKRRSYQLERTLGVGDSGEPQAEYLEGAVANEFTLNIEQAEKLHADLSFVACDNTQRSGETGDEIKSADPAATKVAALGEDAFNTSQNIYRIALSLANPATSTPDALFAYVTDVSISINNNVTPNKAIGVLGAFDTSAGNFEVSGSITAYFTTVEAVRAVRNNADVSLYTISAAKNAGFVFDIPLLGLGGGRVTVEKDQPIQVPVEPAGAQNKFGYTMAYVRFNYLPSIAMP